MKNLNAQKSKLLDKLKNNFNINSISLSIGLLSITSLALMATGSWQQKNAIKQMSLSSGVGTCFQRVTQSFTALMISDFSSTYLTKPFMDTTSECFSYAAKEFNSLYANGFKSGSKAIISLNSDIHWFHEKALKLLKMSQESGLDFSNSNIVNKYTSLEEMKDTFVEGVSLKVENANSNATLLSSIGVLSFMATFFLIGFSLFQKSRRRELFTKIENESERALKSNTDFVSANIERALDNVLTKMDMPNTYSLFNQYHSQLLEKAYKSFHDDNDGVAIDSTPPKSNSTLMENIETTYFRDAIGNTLDSVSEKLFSRGVLLNTDLEDNFNVKGEQELIEQLVFSLLNFASDKTLQQKDSRQINIVSRALGATAYFKLNISNYCFNASELDSHHSISTLDNQLTSELTIAQEIANDLGLSLELKNAVSLENKLGCEIKVVFDRVRETGTNPNKALTSVTKGSKRDILKSFNQSI